MKIRRNGHASVAVMPALVATTLVATFATLIGAAQAAAPTTKPYTAQFDAGPVAAGSSDGSVTVDVVLTNLASPQMLGSAEVTAQSGFTITGATFDGAGDVDESSSTTTALRLVNLGIAPNTSRTVTMSVTTPCSVAANDKWGIRAKQSNDFSGTPGNDFSLRLSGSNLHTAVSGTGGTAAELVFTQQPSSAAKNMAIAPPVTVEVVDSCGSTTDPSGSVSLSLLPPSGGGGVLGGDVSQPLSSGVATFSDLTVSESGFGYKLKASFPGLANVESSAFDVYDSLCPPTCTAFNDDTRIDVQGFDGSAGLSVGNVTTPDCGALTPLGSTFAIVPLSSTSGTYRAVLTIEKPALQGVGVSNIVVCMSETREGALQPLPNCGKKNPQPKCVVSKTSTNAGDAVITMLLDGDPFGGGFS